MASQFPNLFEPPRIPRLLLQGPPFVRQGNEVYRRIDADALKTMMAERHCHPMRINQADN
jgi:hypothetical protein